MTNHFYRKLVIIFLSLSGILYSMDKEAEFSQLKKWKDVQPFAGKVVAFKAIYSYEESIKYQFSDSSLTYGYISEDAINWRPLGNKGYAISLLIKKEAIPSIIALTTNYIVGPKNKQWMLRDVLEMRLVNLHEAREFVNAFNEHKAKLCTNRCTDEENAIKYLIDRLKE